MTDEQGITLYIIAMILFVIGFMAYASISGTRLAEKLAEECTQTYRVRIEGSDGKMYYGTLIPADEPTITIRLDNGEIMKFESDEPCCIARDYSQPQTVDF